MFVIGSESHVVTFSDAVPVEGQLNAATVYLRSVSRQHNIKKRTFKVQKVDTVYNVPDRLHVMYSHRSRTRVAQFLL